MIHRVAVLLEALLDAASLSWRMSSPNCKECCAMSSCGCICGCWLSHCMGVGRMVNTMMVANPGVNWLTNANFE
jgi:hypothetical protein